MKDHRVRCWRTSHGIGLGSLATHPSVKQEYLRADTQGCHVSWISWSPKENLPFMTHPPSLWMANRSNSHLRQKSLCGPATFCAHHYTYMWCHRTNESPKKEVLSWIHWRQSHFKNWFWKRDILNEGYKEGWALFQDKKWHEHKYGFFFYNWWLFCKIWWINLNQ